MPYENIQIDKWDGVDYELNAEDKEVRVSVPMETLAVEYVAQLAGKAEAWLVNFHECEKQRPERVMRQFGLVQSKPPVPEFYKRWGPSRPSKNWDNWLGQYKTQWKNFCRNLLPIVEGEPVAKPSVFSGVEPGYNEWFSTITVKLVIPRGSEKLVPYIAFQQLVSLLFLIFAFHLYKQQLGMLMDLYYNYCAPTMQRSVSLELVDAFVSSVNLENHPELASLIERVQEVPSDPHEYVRRTHSDHGVEAGSTSNSATGIVFL